MSGLATGEGGPEWVRHPRGRSSSLLWALFIAIAAADVVLPGPSFSVFCVPVFFALLATTGPRNPWPLAFAASCFLVGAWLLEQGLRTGIDPADLAPYRLADRFLVSLTILLLTGAGAWVDRHRGKRSDERTRAGVPVSLSGRAVGERWRRVVLVGSLVSLALIFILDILTPRNLNVGSLYLLPLLWISTLESSRIVALVAPAAASISLGGFFLGPPSTVVPEPALVLLERVVTVVALLATGIVLLLIGGIRKRALQSSEDERKVARE